MHKSSLLLSLSVIALLFAGCSGAWKPKEQPKTDTQQTQVQSTIKIIQSVEVSNFNSPDPISVPTGKNALELLKTTHAVVTKNYEGVGEFVESIDGNKADSKHFWSFYINGQPSQVGAGQYVLKDGDKVEWKLETIK